MALPGVLFCLMVSLRCGAQENEAPRTTTEPTYKLHVYEDLVQVSALVLNGTHESVPGLLAGDFKISLDSGPLFHPRHVHVESEEPISLGLLVDISKKGTVASLQRIDEAVAHLPAGLLHPEDRVSVFGFDCEMMQSISHAPASNSVLQAGVAALSTIGALKPAPGERACQKHVQLWDAIGVAAQMMDREAGHRVLIVLSTGHDGGSRNHWETVREYANAYSIAVFGLRNTAMVQFWSAAQGGPAAFRAQEDPFALLCGGSGGLASESKEDELSTQLGRILQLVRARYILEFPRPSNGTAGRHELVVETDHSGAQVLVSGVSVPLRDANLLKDPSTVPNDPGRAPVQGTRSILKRPP